MKPHSFSLKYWNDILCEWTHFIHNEPVDQTIIRKKIFDSWKRCRSQGLNPYQKYNKILKHSEWEDAQKKSAPLIKAAKDYLEIIYTNLGVQENSLILTDHNGVVLRAFSYGDSKRPSTYLGNQTDEKGSGTGSVTLCLASGEPEHVFGAEHYLQIFHNYVFFSAPILDKYKKLVGVLCISQPCTNYHPYTEALVKVGAAAISYRYDKASSHSAKLHSSHSGEASASHTAPLHTFSDIKGSSPALEQAKSIARRVACTDAPVLITGESGVGKELFAHAIHNASLRQSGPFVIINCGALNREFINAELFGYVEGAFTGAIRGGKPGKLELADGGTIFLDEIGELPLDCQSSLLRFLQEHEISRLGGITTRHVDVRILAATNKNLLTDVSRGIFRNDLYYRISAITLHIPSLRESPENIHTLAENFLQVCIKNSHIVKRRYFSSDALAKLNEYHWPGNIRELKNTVERAYCLSTELKITAEDLGLFPLPAMSATQHQDAIHIDENIWRNREFQILCQCLSECNGNVSKAIRRLNMPRSTFYAKLKKYGLKSYMYCNKTTQT